MAARRIPGQLAERPLGKEGGPAPGPGLRALRPGRRPDGEEASETCTLITTLLDEHAAPAAVLRDAYPNRWTASETTFGENKATITGAGNRASGPVLRSGCPRLAEQEAWAWLAGTQLVRASEAAALRSEEAAARALRRKDARPVTADEESFTAAWHHVVRSMETTQVTATSSLAGLAAAADAAARAHLHTLNIPGRDRHSPREQKARPKFPHTSVTEADRHREIRRHRVRALEPLLSRRPVTATGRREIPPRGPWNRAPDPPRHAGHSHARPHQPNGR